MLLCSLLIASAVEARPAGQLWTKPSVRHGHSLSRARITASKPLEDGGANTGKKILTFGRKTRALAKPPSAITMLEITKGSEPAREVLTYRSSRRLFGTTRAVIPETTFRTIDGVRHSIQRWIPRAVPKGELVTVVTRTLPFGEVRFTNYQRRIPRAVLQRMDVDSVHALVILDYLTNHPDRRPDNWMVVERAGRYHLQGIDNGVNWVLDRKLPREWVPANDPLYFALELARAGLGDALSPALQRRLDRTDKKAWAAELRRNGLSAEEVGESLRALERVQRQGLRGVCANPRQTAPAELVTAGLALFQGRETGLD